MQKLKAGTIVQFANPEDPEEADLRMRILEDNGNRVLVEYLFGWDINPTQTIPRKDVMVSP